MCLCKTHNIYIFETVANRLIIQIIKFDYRSEWRSEVETPPPPAAGAVVQPVHGPENSSNYHSFSQLNDLLEVSDQIVIIVQILVLPQVLVCRAVPNVALGVDVWAVPAAP